MLRGVPHALLDVAGDPRLEHDVELAHEEAAEIESLSVGGEPCPLPRERQSASDLLSAELDEFGRDPVYEAAARAAG